MASGKSGAQQLSRQSRIKIKIDAKARKHILDMSVNILIDEYQKRSCALQDKILRLTPDKLGPALACLSESDRVSLYAAHNKTFPERLKTEIVELESNGTISWSNGIQLITGRRGVRKAIAQLKPSFAEGEMQWPEFEAMYSEGFHPIDLLRLTFAFNARTAANKINRPPRRQRVS
jgi:hypothetical protein